MCGGACVNTQTSNAHCGRCGNACATGYACTTGVCAWRAMLDAVNAARATARMCGTQRFAAAPPLRWNTQLEAAALAHSQHMATVNCFSHDMTGAEPCRDGTPCSRAVAAGYRYSRVGENIAAGATFSTVDAVVRAWLDSPGHCANIMNSALTEIGAARVDRSTSRYRIYWTQVFGTPGTASTCP